MGKEIDRKVQEAVDKVVQGFAEWVSSAVTKALEKMVAKNKGRDDEHPLKSSSGGKQPSPSWRDEWCPLNIEFLLRPVSLPTRSSHSGYKPQI